MAHNGYSSRGTVVCSRRSETFHAVAGFYWFAQRMRSGQKPARGWVVDRSFSYYILKERSFRNMG